MMHSISSGADAQEALAKVGKAYQYLIARQQSLTILAASL